MKYLRITIAVLSLILGLSVIESDAATFVVTNTNDSGAGSLRQALLEANSNSQDDVINFDPAVFGTPQVITLTSGDLFIGSDGGFGNTRALTINGPGAEKLTISGNNHSRVFRVESYGKAVIDGVTVRDGNGTNNGPAVDLNARGGGIYVEGGALGNGARNLILRNSVVTNNSATLNLGSGGGILLFGQVTIINCAIVNNFANSGGGINNPNAEVIIINSTISGNSSSGTGGIKLNGGFLTLINSTVAFNRSLVGSNGGIDVSESQHTSTRFHALNSIIAKNTGTSSNYGNDILGPLRTGGNNIIGSTVGASVTPGMPGNRLDVDPELDPNLALNGGVIPNHAIASLGSPAIDNGDNCVLTATTGGGCVASPLTIDARGVTRPQDGDGDGTAQVDIGAVETSTAETVNVPARADLAAANDTGVSDSDNITQSRNLTLTVGNLTTGATVEFYRDNVLLESVTATGNTLSFTDSNLPADGVFVYRSRQIVNGTPSISSPYLTVKIDNTSPTVTVNQATIQFDPTTAQPLNYVAVFNETVANFEAADLSFEGSTAGTANAGVNISVGNPTFNISVSNVFPDGIVTVSVPANRVEDLAGNSNTASTSTDNSITLDYTAPAVTINQAAAQSDPTRFMPVNFTVTFSEPVTGFNNADVSLAGSTASVASAFISVSGSGTTYNVSVSNIFSNGGFVQASIRPQAASDVAGNLSAASTSTDNTVTIDNTSPTVTINQAAGQTDPTNVLPVNYTVTFSEPVTGFNSASDITFTGSTINTAQATVTITGSGTTYNVAIGGNLTSNGGTLQVRVVNGAAQDAIGNPNLASTSTDNTVRLDNVAPTVTINQAIGQADPTATQPVNFTVVFNELVSGFSAADVSLAGSTANVSAAAINVTGSGSVYTVSVSNVTSGGQVRASVNAGAAQDAVGNASAASVSTDNTITVSVVSRSRIFDFDGDRRTDIAIFRPGAGEWWYSRSTDNQTRVLQFGAASDKLVPTDYTGDGKTDIAVWRPATGEWFILRSEDNSFYSIPFGQAGDIPAPGDFDGDGKGDLSVFRPADATWYMQLSSGGYAIRQFGAPGDQPAVGDYDGDAKSDIAIFRPADGSWWYLQSTDNQARVFAFGVSTDKPVPGDYTGDGRTDIAVFRPATGEWFIQRSEDNSFYSLPFGQTSDIPAPGDYDGDGKFDTAVFRPSTNTWYVQTATAGTLIAAFGSAGDAPVAAAFIP